MVGISPLGNASEFNALANTLTNFGFPVRVVTNSPWTGVNVLVSYPGCYSANWGPSLTDITNGVGFVKISDWGNPWTPVTYLRGPGHPHHAEPRDRASYHSRASRFLGSARLLELWCRRQQLCGLEHGCDLAQPGRRDFSRKRNPFAGGQLNWGWPCGIYRLECLWHQRGAEWPGRFAECDFVGRKFVDFPSGPVITAQPISQSVAVGANVAFCVTASGTPPLDYFWQRSGTNIASATNGCYTINNVQLADSGSQFSCVVSNAYGTTNSQTATLTVLALPPLISQQPTNQTVLAGGTASFSVTPPAVCL